MFHTYILNTCCFIIIFQHAATKLKCWSDFGISVLESSLIASTYGQPSSGKKDFEIVQMCQYMFLKDFAGSTRNEVSLFI